MLMSTRLLTLEGRHLGMAGMNTPPKGGPGRLRTPRYGPPPASLHVRHPVFMEARSAVCSGHELNINHGIGSGCTPSRGLAAGEKGPGASQPRSVWYCVCGRQTGSQCALAIFWLLIQDLSEDMHASLLRDTRSGI